MFSPKEIGMLLQVKGETDTWKQCFFCASGSNETTTLLGVPLFSEHGKTGVLLFVPACRKCGETSAKDLDNSAKHVITELFKLTGPCECRETEEDKKAVVH